MDGRTRLILIIVAGVCTATSCNDSEEPSIPVAPATWIDDDVMRRVVRASPVPAVPSDLTNRYADDPSAAQFGQWLFHDERLSGTGTFSCASCHDPQKDFTDGLARAHTIREGERHTPSLLNVAHQKWVTWDGGSDSLWAHGLRPMENPDEMNGDRLAFVHLIASDEALRAAYEQIFGSLNIDIEHLPQHGRPGDDPALAQAWDSLEPDVQQNVMVLMANVGKAMAAYQRQLNTGETPFDRYVQAYTSGKSTEGHLSPSAERGMNLFFGRGECWECHTGPLFSDGEFHNIGLPVTDGELPKDAGRYRGAKMVKNDPFNASGDFSDDPDGTWAKVVRGTRIDPDTWGAFKTPSLRGVSDTAPYMHAGQLEDLEAVVRFYSTLEGAVQLDHHQESVLSPLGFSEAEIDDVVEFLRSLKGQKLPSDVLIKPQKP